MQLFEAWGQRSGGTTSYRFNHLTFTGMVGIALCRMVQEFKPDGESIKGFQPSTGNGTRSQVRGRVGRGEHVELLEGLYEQWRGNPDSVDSTWRAFFEGFELGCQTPPPQRSKAKAGETTTSLPDPSGLPLRLKQARIYNLLFAYRTLGHRAAKLDPLEICKPGIPELDMHHFKFSEADLDNIFDSGTLAGGGDRPLWEILDILEKTYCRNIGVEYMHIQDFTMRRWLRDRMENCLNEPRFIREKKKRILTKVLAAEQFEKYLHTRFVGQKRFSAEGAETIIPMLDALVEGCPGRGISQVVMGMAHRARLNVLANFLGKDYKTIFTEFHENYIPKLSEGDGDVKYHLGFESKVTTTSGHQVGISLAPNPSHLEAVDPVVQGKARAWQRLLNDTGERGKVLPLLIHGDAAVVGQGVVAETFNLSRLEGYRTGGTIHVIINNQIGFTTRPEDARSSFYCTAIAKMIEVPVFHVNGDDPLSAVYVLELAMDFRQRFKSDVIIDMVCYRRHGHNESDEPSFTQPTLYSEISEQPWISETLMKTLIDAGDINPAEAEAYQENFNKQLNDHLAESKAIVSGVVPAIRNPMSQPALLQPFHSSVPLDTLVRIGEAITREPEHIKINSKIQRFMSERREMIRGNKPIDWSFGEALAFGTLLDSNLPVRLSGQDCRRGTFSQRHSVLYDVETRERYVPLRNISEDQASFCVYNSPLSEAAVLGFDFGYSLDYPTMLCIWEAQFGDFANGAQTIIDQYIVCSESKWGVNSSITLLLPHGYHGQGPEHSSGRMERFLQLCAEDNLQVANCTTPASYFHILRRQAIRPLRKPLVLFTPKGLLRDPRCVSDLDAFAGHSFQEILPDYAVPEGAKRIILCSGKVYYDLDDYRKKVGDSETAILRLEQLYPLNSEMLSNIAKKHQGANEILWCQEESSNMGAWSYIEPRLRKLFGCEIAYAGRDESASPATGSLAIHQLEQKDLIERAFRRK